MSYSDAAEDLNVSDDSRKPTKKLFADRAKISSPTINKITKLLPPADSKSLQHIYQSEYFIYGPDILILIISNVVGLMIVALLFPRD
jgi:hypothetical protein